MEITYASDMALQVAVFSRTWPAARQAGQCMPHKDGIDGYFISVGERQPAQQVCIAKNSFPMSRASLRTLLGGNQIGYILLGTSSGCAAFPFGSFLARMGRFAIRRAMRPVEIIIIIQVHFIIIQVHFIKLFKQFVLGIVGNG
jgi:hypothetical protein